MWYHHVVEDGYVALFSPRHAAPYEGRRPGRIFPNCILLIVMPSPPANQRAADVPATATGRIRSPAQPDSGKLYKQGGEHAGAAPVADSDMSCGPSASTLPEATGITPPPPSAYSVVSSVHLLIATAVSESTAARGFLRMPSLCWLCAVREEWAVTCSDCMNHSVFGIHIPKITDAFTSLVCRYTAVLSQSGHVRVHFARPSASGSIKLQARQGLCMSALFALRRVHICPLPGFSLFRLFPPTSTSV